MGDGSGGGGGHVWWVPLWETAPRDEPDGAWKWAKLNTNDDEDDDLIAKVQQKTFLFKMSTRVSGWVVDWLADWLVGWLDEEHFLQRQANKKSSKSNPEKKTEKNIKQCRKKEFSTPYTTINFDCVCVCV